MDLKKQYNSNNVSPVAKLTSHVIATSSSKDICRKRSNSHQHNEDDLATLLRHSADDEDEGDEEVNKYRMTCRIEKTSNDIVLL